MQTKLPSLTISLPIIGALLASALYFTRLLPLGSPGLEASRYLIITLAGLLLTSFPGKRPLLLLVSSFAIATFFAISTFFSNRLANFPSYTIVPGTWLIISTYITACFHHVYYSNKQPQQTYPALFNTSWNLLFTLLLALIFTLLCWLVLRIGCYLFEQIGYNQIENFLFSSAAEYSLTGIFCGLSFAIARENSALVESMQRICFALCYFLLPILAIFGLLYLPALFFGKQQHDLDYAIYTNLTVIALIFFNIYYQPLTRFSQYQSIINHLIQLFFILLPIYPILAFRELFLRLGCEKPDALLISLLWFNLILIFYAISYLPTSIQSTISGIHEKQKHRIGKINIILALLFILIGFLLNSPLLNPKNTADYLSNHKLISCYMKKDVS